MDRAVSFFGLLLMMVLAWGLSSRRKLIPWRLVIVAPLLQFGLAALILKTGQGRWFFASLGTGFSRLQSFTDQGARIVFGDGFQEHFFAFSVLPTIIFYSALISVLYHFGIMQAVVRALAMVMQLSLRTSGAETFSAAANIFVGQTEAPLLVKPYLPTMTRSELMAVMVGGFATIAGGVMAMYVGFGISPGHLMTASVISAPAGLLIAKLIEPEHATPQTAGRTSVALPKVAGNVFEAATLGASDGLRLALNVGAMLIAFTALIALADSLVTWCGTWFGQQWSLGLLLGTLFRPLAWVMGISWKDSLPAGELLGLKMAASELVAYDRMAAWLKPGSGVVLEERTIVILTYALCGFSNFASIGIQIGGIGAMAPERQREMAELGMRAMLGGTLACCMTACVAGVLI